MDSHSILHSNLAPWNDSFHYYCMLDVDDVLDAALVWTHCMDRGNRNRIHQLDIAECAAISNCRRYLDCFLWQIACAGMRKLDKISNAFKLYKQDTHFRLNIRSSFVPCILEVVGIFCTIIFKTSHMILIELIKHISCEWSWSLLFSCFLSVNKLKWK